MGTARNGTKGDKAPSTAAKERTLIFRQPAAPSNATENTDNSSLFLPTTTTELGKFLNTTQRHGQNGMPEKTKKIVGGVVGGVGGALAMGLLAGFLGAMTTTTMPSVPVIETRTSTVRSTTPWVFDVSHAIMSPASMVVSIHESSTTTSTAILAGIGNNVEEWWWWVAIITLCCCAVCIAAILLLFLTRRSKMKKWMKKSRAVASNVYSQMLPSSPSSFCSETSMLEPDSDTSPGKELAISMPSSDWGQGEVTVSSSHIAIAPPRQEPMIRNGRVFMGRPHLPMVQELYPTTTPRIVVPAFMPSSVARPVPLQQYH